MCFGDEIRAKLDEIYAIERKHKAERLWAPLFLRPLTDLLH